MSRESGKDLTSGSPFGLILGFALPMLLGLLFQQFYNMVDTIIVGQLVGAGALAAVAAAKATAPVAAASTTCIWGRSSLPCGRTGVCRPTLARTFPCRST